MAEYYSALTQMRKRNLETYGNLGIPAEQIGPMQPSFQEAGPEKLDLKTAAVQFLHKSCQDLRFGPEEAEGAYTGKSSKDRDIPYNMQMDIERLCLERAVKRFLDSGVKNDAFDIYFCFLEMFLAPYAESGKMIEMLSEFENNGGSLLMKHRDHYSHSAYVFALGLAIFETNATFRAAYGKLYGGSLEQGQTLAHHFLKYWGFASLFHDIGYPFELPFEQVKSYFGGGDKNTPFLAYQNINPWIVLDGKKDKDQKEEKDETEEKKERKALKKLLGKEFENLNQVFAYATAQRICEDYESCTEGRLFEAFDDKPSHPDRYGKFMDHAYFSAVILAKQLLKRPDDLTSAHIDALTAIILHNSLYKFTVTDYKNVDHPFKMALHPLAYLLMYCDELQCWDRTAYGRNSRTELHAMNCHFRFLNNGIQAVYLFDKAEKRKIDSFDQEYEKWAAAGREEEKEPKRKSYSTMVHEQTFRTDIEKIVDTGAETGIPLSVETELVEADNINKHTYLSDSDFLHLHQFAVALNARYEGKETIPQKEMEQTFNGLSLEYKLSNILQAKELAAHLDAIGMFYTDRPVDYEMVEKFSDDDLQKLGVREHVRWENEKRSMCWLPAVGLAKLVGEDKNAREQLRMHNLLDVKFDELPREEQIKDTEPMNTMLRLLKEYDGLRIWVYRMDRQR